MRSLRVEDTLKVAPELPRLRLPAAVVWGAGDRFQKIGYGRRLASDLDAGLNEIPTGRPFVPEDHPGRVAAAINGVLARSRG